MPLTLAQQSSTLLSSNDADATATDADLRASRHAQASRGAATGSATVPSEQREALPTPSILPAFAMSLPAAQWIDGFPPARRTALARAQAAWLTRQVTLDPRLALYSSQITADELYHAMRVFRSLFDRAASADVNVRAALDWASVLVDAADAAERAGAVSPLPYLWMPTEELDAVQTAHEQVTASRSRRRSKRAN